MVSASVRRSAQTAGDRISDYMNDQPIVGLAVVAGSIAGGVFGGMVALDEVIGTQASRAKRGVAGLMIAAVAMVVAANIDNPGLGMIGAGLAFGMAVSGFLPRDQLVGESTEAEMIRQQMPQTRPLRRASLSGEYR